MKKVIFVIGMTSVIWSCNSNDKKKTDETKTDSQTGVQNVNGNIPDTTNAIKLSTDKKTNSGVSKDSAK